MPCRHLELHTYANRGNTIPRKPRFHDNDHVKQTCSSMHAVPILCAHSVFITGTVLWRRTSQEGVAAHQWKACRLQTWWTGYGATCLSRWRHAANKSFLAAYHLVYLSRQRRCVCVLEHSMSCATKLRFVCYQAPFDYTAYLSHAPDLISGLACTVLIDVHE